MAVKMSKTSVIHISVLRRRKLVAKIIRRLGSSASEPTKCVDFLTNGGVVEGVWVFCRHGDRTPTRPLCAKHMIEAEAEFWRTKLPKPSPTKAFEALSKCFMPTIHQNNNEEFLDGKKEPFGFLTQRGMEQLKTMGRRFFLRYDQYGHQAANGVSRPEDFFDFWDVRAISTNYLRTVLSVQCFLDGLAGTNCYIPHDTSPLDEECTDKDIHVTVNVRDRSKDTLNAFDRNPDLMMNLVSNVVSTRQFQERDATAAPLAARLANFLPGLADKGRKVFGGPSGINWIHATDHFICRSSHQVKFSRFSVFEQDDRAEHTLSAMAHQTVAHLAWRFRQWYQSPPLLAAIAAPPLKEIGLQIQAACSYGVHEPRPFVIYSCHDVTILALLYGIGAEFLADEEKGDWRFWPSYASTLVFELVRVQEGADQNSHVVRVLLNGNPVRVVDFAHASKGEEQYVGKGPLRMLRVSDFMDVVTRLEERGGLDKNFWDEEEDDTAERDMSNWTG